MNWLPSRFWFCLNRRTSIRDSLLVSAMKRPNGVSRRNRKSSSNGISCFYECIQDALEKEEFIATWIRLWFCQIEFTLVFIFRLATWNMNRITSEQIFVRERQQIPVADTKRSLWNWIVPFACSLIMITIGRKVTSIKQESISQDC